MKNCKCGCEPEILYAYQITGAKSKFMIHCQFCGMRTLAHSSVLNAFKEWDRMIEGVKDRYEK